jgi:hypothetical protein
VLLGNIFLHPGAPHRRKSGVCHVIPTIGTHPISLSIHSLGFKQLCFFSFWWQVPMWSEQVLEYLSLCRI